ncbi:tRNA pseudouridine(55) synthase TruB [[Limnothrix rosea] IAM M-220]|uniref:tRNA pseudouridine(55) synthase TruB n=1 Tax=[Limnothrix rosea] IAM M-220 TaxID=454133 RepID=UPI000965B6D8|nr:tRNA pseudouridine(55) synthase TruB [[Limnothrix rosea] IAM M-220]OKH18336.1 tRNA pseudouridine(55) synthase TruB [[Limnothrix rosea] IAM M-220]
MVGDRQKFAGWGFINLNKPAGWTSHDCIAKLRRLLGLKKIGHGGTLDPMATGVLPVAVGKATRLLPYLPKAKVYKAVIRFGVRTATDDLEGAAIAEIPCPNLTLAEVTAQLPKFRGKITQIPPAFSAIKKDGKPLYELARQGIEVEVPSREVEILALNILGWRSGDFPELDLEVHCGEGTYIRAIARDLGVTLGTGATLAGLVRTASGGFSLEHSLTIEAIETQLEKQTFICQRPNQLLQHLHHLVLQENQAIAWSFGQKIPWVAPPVAVGKALGVYDTAEQFLGIGEFKPSKTEADQLVLAPRLVMFGK